MANIGTGEEERLAMGPNDLQRQTFRWSEELRKAVNRGDQKDAVDVFAGVSSAFPGGDSLAVTAVLIGELVQFVDEIGIGEFVRDYDPATSSLLDDYAVFGRSDEFFSEVMSFIMATEADELARATATLVNMSIAGARLPSADLQSSWSDAWWDQISDLILDRNVEDAVLGTIERGELDQAAYMGRLTTYLVEFLDSLLVHEGGLATLKQVKPEASALVDAYLNYDGNCCFLAVRLEMDRIGPSDFSDVLLAIVATVIAFKAPRDDDGLGVRSDDHTNPDELSLGRADHHEGSDHEPPAHPRNGMQDSMASKAISVPNVYRGPMDEPVPPLPRPGWHDDPNDPTSLRYWDGSAWTENRAPKRAEVPQSPPGWHDDPNDPNSLRYWDGTAWTDHRAPKPAAPTSGGAAPPASPAAAQGVATGAGPSAERVPPSGVDSSPVPTDIPAPAEAAAFAEAFWFASDSTLKSVYSGASLPGSAPPMARFFADLMCGVAGGIPGMIDEVRKGYKKMGFYSTPPEGWRDELLAVGVGFTIYMLSEETGSDLLVAGPVGDHYRRLVGQVHQDLTAFVQPDIGAEPSQMFAKLGRIISELADRRGVKLTKNSLELPIVAMGGYVGGRKALDQMGFSLPMTMTEALGKVAAASAPMPYGQATARAAAVTEPSSRTYPEWKDYCLQLADRRAVPRRFAEELLPAEAELDWQVKPLREFEEMLERSFPGRRAWLIREGVTSADFERFWNRPPWVQNYIEALVNLNLQLEIRGQLDRGEDEELAYAIAAVSLPLYGNEPDSADSPGFKVPWELFDRVEAYWAKLDMAEIERGAMTNGWRTAAARIRAEVVAGVL